MQEHSSVNFAVDIKQEVASMKTLETNDWMILNSIIYKIYATEEPEEMRRQLIDQMKMVLDFDSADFYLAAADGDKSFSDPVRYNCDEDENIEYGELEFSKSAMYSGKCLVIRETDMISDETRTQMEYYRKIYRPNNWHYSLQMILGKGKEFLGVITFYRTIGKDNFHYDDIFLLDMLKDHLALRLSKDKANADVMERKMSISEATEKFELTKREHTILQLLMAGKDNGIICDELSISVNTLKKHILNIYRKLGIKNRVQMFKMIREKE